MRRKEGKGMVCLLLMTTMFAACLAWHRGVASSTYGRFTVALASLRTGGGDLESLELREFLSEESLQQTRDRFVYLQRLFPQTTEEELHEIIRQTPLLVLSEFSMVEDAVSNLGGIADLSYLLTQKKAGQELLFSGLHGQVRIDYQAAIKELEAMVGKKHNVTELVRRVPQALLPRYREALGSHVMTLCEELSCSKQDALEIIEKFPSILGISPLRASLSRLRLSLERSGLIDATSETASATPATSVMAHKRVKYGKQNGGAKKHLVKERENEGTVLLRKIVTTVPRVLAHDVSRRVAMIKVRFPLWKLTKIVSGNPRVLTQKMEILQEHYEALKNELGEGYDVDALINAMPSSLHRSPDGLVEKLQELLTLFPSTTGPALLETAPDMVFSFGTSCLESKASKLRKLFVMVEEGQQQYEIDEDDIEANPLDLTRLVMCNHELFLKRFPYMIDKLSLWLEEFNDSAIVYSVLSTVPSVLIKKPSYLHEGIKCLYGIAAQGLIEERRVCVTQNYGKGKGGGGGDVGGIVSSPPTSAHNPGPTCEALKDLLLDAPSALRCSREAIEARVRDLVPLLLANNEAHVKRLLISGAGRLLTDPLNRIRLRVELAKLLHDFCNSHASTSRLPFLDQAPRLFAAPSSFFARLFFLRYRYRQHKGNDVNINVMSISTSNTQQFIELYAHGDVKGFEVAYRLFLTSIASKLEEHIGNQLVEGEAGDMVDAVEQEEVEDKEREEEPTTHTIVMEESAEALERRVCGLLNALALEEQDVARIDRVLVSVFSS